MVGELMHFLITGHTGFKGSWMTMLLKEFGHTVSGISLDPAPGGIFELGRITTLLDVDARLDIRDSGALTAAVGSIRPDVVIHMAAQPLVRESYADPRLTFETNVMGTYNVLEAISSTPSIAASVIVTTDKVYRNAGQRAGYVESDPLGGDDPYSSSKAMADLLTQSWIKSFGGAPVAIARAGNVIGGGDVSKDRLLVDLVACFLDGRITEIRYPDAVRPWQHVLDCVNGYRMLVDYLLAGGSETLWNFGPDQSQAISVREMADEAVSHWRPEAGWSVATAPKVAEATLLTLDAERARGELGWHDLLQYPESLHWTLDWYRQVAAGADASELTRQQVRDYMGRAATAAAAS